MTEKKYLVLDEATSEDLGGIPTPRLLDEGRGEAYRKATPDYPAMGGIWYLRDDRDGYTSPDGKYRRVRIVRNLRYQGY